MPSRRYARQMPTPRPATGAAVLQAELTTAIITAVIADLSEKGYARVTMDGVAKRAGVGKSALYRRWPSKLEMVLDVAASISVPLAEVPDTGALRGDIRASVEALTRWLSDPPFATIIPDLVAETARSPSLAPALEAAIGQPRRDHAAVIFDRAAQRGELAPGADVEFALDLLAGPLYWRLGARHVPVDPGYLDRLTDLIVLHLAGPGRRAG